jgi:hypothetical protein
MQLWGHEMERVDDLAEGGDLVLTDGAGRHVPAERRRLRGLETAQNVCRSVRAAVALISAHDRVSS